jgi:hypothetical protein
MFAEMAGKRYDVSHCVSDYFEEPMTSSSFLKKRFARDERMVFRKLGNESVLVPICRTPEAVVGIYTLSDVAAYIWEAIDGERSVEEIRDQIVQEWEVTPQTAEIDLTEFMEQLISIGALKEVEVGMPPSSDSPAV